MIQELDSVALVEDLPEHGLAKGDVGTVVLTHQGGAGYEVEFVSLTGETVAVASLFASQVRTLRRFKMTNARALTPAKV